ncbi:hypothetical protein [Sinorhizobium sp. CCBAU 05631]|uniref:hypothetical protein n=1 Tax=Sinorhizobium sp. CCBAU 05631 TaxID=794846 RepID=UPI0004B12A74|nr:hypothetical protein [Sinorhizobium sp. CCBAU 05631]ASY55409.1 hypothetical protein SS05631_c04530 [Sinorhizobium sp. CCBAU 05631]
MRLSLALFGRSITVEACGLSYLYIETNSREFTYDRHQWFELPAAERGSPSGEFRHWLLEKKLPYQPPLMLDEQLPNAA